MTILVIGLVVFMALHALPWLRGARASLVGSLGEGPYKGLYSLASAVGLVLIIWGYAVADQVPVYDPPAWGRHLAMLLVLLAFVALAVYLHKGRLRLWLRHPMLTAVALWATGHLLANGDLASVVLFGAFLVYALVDMAVATAQGRLPRFEPKPRHDVIAPVAGVVLYVVALFLHPYVIGVPVIAV